MYMSDILSIGLAVTVAIIVILLLIWKNKKDKKLLNPDAQDSVEETMMDHKRREEKA